MSSWFSELTDKAGAFLNNLDQVTASSLQEAGIGSPPTKTSTAQVDNRRTQEPALPSYSTPTSNSKDRATSVAQVLVGSASESPHLSPLSGTPRTPSGAASSSYQHNHLQTSSSKVSDDSLFHFLNSPTTSNGAKRRSERSTPNPPTFLDTKASLPHPNSAPMLDKLDLEDVDLTDHENREPENKRMEVEKVVVTNASNVEDQKDYDNSKAAILFIESQSTGEEEIDASAEDDLTLVVSSAEEGGQLVPGERNTSSSPTDALLAIAEAAAAEATSELEKWKKAVSNLELENKLMKREVMSLNEELGGVMGRLAKSSQSSTHYQSEIHALREQASQSDQLIRQLRSQADDLEAGMQTKDTQVQALQLELSGHSREVEGLKNQLLLSRNEQERLLQDANLSSGAHSQALDSVKAQLTETEAQLMSLRDEHLKEKTVLLERESLLQAEKVQLSQDLAGAERQAAQEQGKVRDYQATLQSLQKELHLLKREHEDYKQRAGGILQAKEKLIQSLQGGEGVAGGGGSGVEDARVEEVRLEKEQVQGQLSHTLRQLEQVKSELKDLEERSSVEVGSAMEQVRVCEGVLEEERRHRRAVQEEAARLTQELQLLREDLDRERSCHRENVQVKEKEVSDLKLQMATSVTPGKKELEVRLHQMTDSLIQKQTALETLNSERSTLNVQVKRLQEELTHSKTSKPSAIKETVVQMNGPELLSEAAAATGVPSMTSMIPPLNRAPMNSRLHNVRQAVNCLDRMSIRLGIFLRRHPQARLMTLLYVVLLHLWVMFVLVTYSPEIHPNNNHLTP